MTWRNRNLYLIGLPGAGKSAIGRELAELLRIQEYSFVDLDAEIEKRAGKSISEIFASDGEEYFRQLESRELLTLSTQSGKRQIISTGGGIMQNPLNRSIIRGSGIPIWIEVTVREAAKNIRNDILHGRERPLFKELSPAGLREKLRQLLDERRKYYEQATLHFVTRSLSGDERTPKELASELLKALDEMSLAVILKPRHRTLVAHSALGNYPILVGSEIAINELGNTARDRGALQIVIVTDKNVERLHWEELYSKLLKEIGATTNISKITIEGGEECKNIDTLNFILREMYSSGVSRKSALVVAFGGGVVIDIASLAANLYHRGVPLVHIPTTLIAQADAAIGGKTGIDFLGGKNLIGTFYPPCQVLVDPLYLKTLPKDSLRSGLAEVFKYALIGNRRMWDELSVSAHRLIRGVDSIYEKLIHDSILEKLRYVEADEFETKSGVRELLNFGHSFGHALESATEFTTYHHGEAVGYGMRTAAWLSKELGYLSQEDWLQIEATLVLLSTKSQVNVGQIDSEKLLAEFHKDKKGKNRVILLRSIGDGFVTEIQEHDVRKAIVYLLNLL
jgi:shikimate kinase/3-dehydroquinate synthase